SAPNTYPKNPIKLKYRYYQDWSTITPYNAPLENFSWTTIPHSTKQFNFIAGVNAWVRQDNNATYQAIYSNYWYSLEFARVEGVN
ncbi:MAG: hypothetical protein LBM72_01395, partial [Mycoplasmataceae bacterium]|nr:hypothetical protein [Mycoplasmataceae bacterium]